MITEPTPQALADAFLAEAIYHQGVAALHAKMARDWVAEGPDSSGRVLGAIAQRLAAARYDAARDCVDGANEIQHPARRQP